jgi:hypothetical protein
MTIFFLLYYASIGLAVIIAFSSCMAITLIAGEMIGTVP